MIGLILAWTSLIVMMVGAVGYLLLEVVRTIAPYQLFNWHTKLVTKGWYRVKRGDDYFDVRALFVRLRVREYPFDKGDLRLDLDAGFNDYFDAKYKKETSEIQDFNCSSKFAKGVNKGDFYSLLANYIPYVLEREYGKKSERVKAVEKMQSFGLLTHPKKQTPNHSFSSKRFISAKKKNKEVFALLNVVGHSPVVQEHIDAINTIASEIEKEKTKLEIEELHNFETLMLKRLPNILKHTPTHEEEIVVLLKEVLHKMNEWQTSLLEENNNDFAREKTLIKQIIER